MANGENGGGKNQQVLHPASCIGYKTDYWKKKDVYLRISLRLAVAGL
jgi:hypothetical protein